MRIIDAIAKILFTPIFTVPNAKRDAVIARFAVREVLDEQAWIEKLREAVPISDSLGQFLYRELQAQSGLPAGLTRPDDLLDEDLHFWALCYFDADFDFIEDMAYDLQIPQPPHSILCDVKTVADLARSCMSYVRDTMSEHGQA